MVYAVAIEPTRVTISTFQLPQGSLASVLAGRKIALVSDLHIGEDGSPLSETTLQRLDVIRPDLILLLGDFVAWGGGNRAYDRALEFLAKLDAPLGTFAVLGDADRTKSRRSCEFCHQPGSGAPAGSHRAVFLRNEARSLALPHGTIRVVGLDAGFAKPTVPQLSRLLAGDLPTILLSHSSVVYRDIDPTLDVLTASGDTHGGQIRLPRWFWRLTRLKPDPEHIHGLFRDGRKSLVVTRGIGTSRLRFRLGSPPEIVVLEFPGAAR